METDPLQSPPPSSPSPTDTIQELMAKRPPLSADELVRITIAFREARQFMGQSKRPAKADDGEPKPRAVRKPRAPKAPKPALGSLAELGLAAPLKLETE